MTFDITSILRISERQFIRADAIYRARGGRFWEKRRKLAMKDLAWIYNLIMESR